MPESGTTLDLNAKYRVDGYEGIAFRLLGWAVTSSSPEPWLDCLHEDPEEHVNECWVVSDEAEVTESDTWVRVVMVGDDRVHEVEYTDVHPLAEDDYCHECGQIGCTHDGRNS